MFDFGFSELLLVGVVALIVLGPERLPQAARMAGNLVGRLQRLVSSVKQELSAQVELEELRKAKQEFESATSQLKDELTHVSHDAQDSLNDISDGLKPWERLPAQHTPADFGVDEFGRPLADANPDTSSASDNDVAATLSLDDNGQPIAPPAADTPVSEQEQAWRDYLTAPAQTAAAPVVSYVETLPPPVDSLGLHTASLRKQAMQRKRDMRPKIRTQPKLRVRKK